MVSVDRDTKKIIKAVIHSDTQRRKRKRSGKHTNFDTLAEVAIEQAKSEILLEIEDTKIRQYIIEKLYESLAYNTLGETYCCRNLFYEYRTRFINLVAYHMGIICDKPAAVVKSK